MNATRKTLLAGALSALALCAVAAATPILPLGGDGGGHDSGGAHEMTVSIRTTGDAAPTVVHVPELGMGESRTIRSESGKDVVVTRTEEGLSVKIGEKTFLVNGMHGDPGAPGEHADVKTIVTGDGVKKVVVTRHGYGFHTGEDSERMTAAQFLEKHPLAALDRADARTKETVTKALEELVQKGLVIAPGLGMEGLPAGAETGERVEIKVTKTGE